MKQFSTNLKNEFHKIKWSSKKEIGKTLVLVLIGIAALCVLTTLADSAGLAVVNLIA